MILKVTNFLIYQSKSELITPHSILIRILLRDNEGPHQASLLMKSDPTLVNSNKLIITHKTAAAVVPLNKYLASP